MLVTHAEEHVTHAAIGGAAPVIDFGISDNPEFFRILYSNLYKNQKLAVVRETLCNAWDAHIEAGCTDKPIKVSIDGGYLIFQDQGKGIPNELMGPLYGTYGGTTKTNDGRQTGGFGLGCKSPFAYTDHFEVTSCHNGFKTIYNISKASADANGKPGILPLVKIPTTETGLRVKIPLQPGDGADFNTLIQRVAFEGGISVILNENTLPTLPYDKMTSNWLYIHKGLSWRGSRALLVKYGNVLYPIDDTTVRAAGLESAKEAKNLIRTINNDSGHYGALILEAPPNSLAVTPSREELSFQDITIQTLNTLFENFAEEKKSFFNDITPAWKFAKESIKSEDSINKSHLWYFGRRLHLLDTETEIPAYATNVDEINLIYFSQHYPGQTNFHKKVVMTKVARLRKLGARNAGQIKLLAQQMFVKRHYKKELNGRIWKHPNPNYMSPKTFFIKKVIAPLQVGWKEAGLSKDKMYYLTENRWDGYRLLSDFHPYEFEHIIPMLHRTVIITGTMVNIRERANSCPLLSPDFTGVTGYKVFVYHSGRGSKHHTAAKEFFLKKNYQVIDFNEEHAWDKYRPVKPAAPVPNPNAPPKVKKTRPKGWPSLSGVWFNEKTKQLDAYEPRLDYTALKGAPRITEPKAHLRYDPSKADIRPLRLIHTDTSTSKKLVRLFGHEIAMVKSTTPATYRQLVELKLPDFEEYVMQAIIHEVTTNPNILQYWKESLSRANRKSSPYLEDEEVEIIESLLMLPESQAKNAFTKTKLTELEMVTVQVWRVLCDYDYRFASWTLKLKEANELIRNLPVDPAALGLIQKAHKSSILKIINRPAITKLVTEAYSDSDRTKAQKLSALLDTILT